ncbi:MAG: hypothetical protein BGO68_06340 [Candidatus Amoebophilus sp. 36-38]|nr:MAG: hypothetical protein BGO68_06340 [Candidatus Amoebophilus sp. 36-38]
MLKTTSNGSRHIDHSSIGKRLNQLEVKYFKGIYEDLVLSYNTNFSKQEVDKFHRFDSTIITLSGKLLKDGLNLGGKPQDRLIKISVSLKDNIPASVRICKEAAEASENIALKRAINQAKVAKETILLFDRGIAKGDTFNELSESKQYFITRLNVGRKYVQVRENRDNKAQTSNEDSVIEDSSLTILSDEIINLYNQHGTRINCELRLFKTKNQKGEELWFLTNVAYLTGQEVCSSYKRRWDIEVFFKFIKQHLQCKHFISYNNNGMSIYLYCILIAAILFVIYKISNSLTGFKLALLRFTLSAEKAMIKDIVSFCGGKPELVDLKLFSP